MKLLFIVVATGIIFLLIAARDSVVCGATWDNTWGPLSWLGKLSYILAVACLITVFYLGLKKKR